MAETNSILINRIQWDLQAGDLAIARSWQDRVSAFSRNQLSGIVETAFRDHHSDDEVLIINRLEIDLGNLDDESLLFDKIVETLREVVEREMTLRAFNGNENVVTKDNHRSMLEQFEFYLEHGYLPWDSFPANFMPAGKLLPSLYQLGEVRLNAWMERLISGHAARTRLVEFFSSDELKDLLLHSGIPERVIEEYSTIINALLLEAGEGRSPRLAIFGPLLKHFSVLKSSGIRALVLLWTREGVAQGCVTAHGMERIVSALKDWSVAKDAAASLRPSWYQEVSAYVLAGLNGDEETPSEQVGAGEPGPDTETSSIKTMKAVSVEQDSFFVENAGVVLVYPYLKAFFKGQGLTNAGDEFQGRKEQLCAAYWLQFIASGIRDVKEYQLVLPKVLCGYPLEAPLYPVWESDVSGEEVADELLQNAIGRWSKVQHTSVAGFRNSFLLRAGKLTEEEFNWLLHVERKGWDVLLDSLPYPLSVVKLPWMSKPLFIQW